VSAIAARSSIAPVFVVPADATTAIGVMWLAIGERRVERGHVHPVVVVDRDQANRCAAESEELNRLADTAVRLRRQIERKRLFGAAQAVLAHVDATLDVPRDGERGQRRHGTAAHEQPVRLAR
jgi:hypothetical protein